MGDGRLTFGVDPARSTLVAIDDTDVIRTPLDPFEDDDRVTAMAGQRSTITGK